MFWVARAVKISERLPALTFLKPILFFLLYLGRKILEKFKAKKKKNYNNYGKEKLPIKCQIDFLSVPPKI